MAGGDCNSEGGWFETPKRNLFKIIAEGLLWTCIITFELVFTTILTKRIDSTSYKKPPLYFIDSIK